MSRFELRPYQEQFVTQTLQKFRDHRRLLGVMPTGCHASGHPIMMADGSINSVEKVQVGDAIMGPDSMPRHILKLHQGSDEMYRIIPKKGDPFIVNGGHILHLRRTLTGKARDDRHPLVAHISVNEWLQKTKTFRHLHKLERTPIQFSEPPITSRPISPYLLGVLLGDGCLHQGQISVCTPDREIVAELIIAAHTMGSRLRKSPLKDNQADDYYFAGVERAYASEPLRSYIRQLGLAVSSGEKFIPDGYLRGTVKARMELLAGLLDTDGSLSRGCFDYVSKSRRLAEGIVYLARSLGFSVAMSKKTVDGRLYYRLTISGNCDTVPVRIPRKRAGARRQKKNPLVTGFEVEEVGRGEYFGFTLDGDHLYVDGNFLIHHNSGKTVCFSEAAKRIHPVRTLILAHREELLTQAQDKLYRSTGLGAQIEKAEHRASHQADVVIASVQTLMRDKRLQRWPRDHFGLVVVDEAHHALADSYQKVLGHFDGHAKILGVTATPDRGDKRNLGEYFEDIAYEVSLHELIKDGFLSPIAVRTVPIQINLTGVRTTAGDYNDADLGNALEPFLESIVGELGTAVGSRKTIVFLPLVRTSKMFVELCRCSGLSAEHIDGTSSDRAEILKSFANGEFQILCNSMLLTEGFDEPSVKCVICLRPTKIRALYSQIIGRGTRIHPGKDNLLVLDFLWMTEKHSLVRPAHLVAPSEEIASEMIALSEAAAGEDFEQDLMEMVTDAKETRERKLAEELEANAKRKSRLIDPIEFALSLHEVDLADWEPTMRWHSEPASDKQLRTLAGFGFDPKAVPNRGYASIILDRIFSRRDLNLATPKQLHWLRKTGHPKPDLATFAEARTWLDEQFNRRAS